MDDLVRYKQFLIEECGQQDLTIRTNMKIMSLILRKCSPLTAETVKQYIGSLIAQRMSASYIRQIIANVRHWGDLFKIEELEKYTLPKKTKLPRKNTYKATFANDEIESFRQLPYIARKGASKLRYEMMMLVFDIWFYSGMRGKEVCSLETWQIDFGRNIFILPPEKVKTGDARDISISPVIYEKLQEYVKKVKGTFLFPAYFKRKDGEPYITDSACRIFFNKQIKRLGIKRPRLTPYSARHSFGKRMAEQDVSIFKIKKLMGHRRITTTEKYIYMTNNDLHEIIENDSLAVDKKSGIDQIQDITSEIGKLMKKYKKVITALIPDTSGKKLTIIFEAKQ